MECYFDWYRFFDATRLLFARRKLIGSDNSYWTSVERDCLRHKVVIESWEEIKEKLKKNTFPNIIGTVSLINYTKLCQGNMFVQDYITKFEDLTLCCDLSEHRSHIVIRFVWGLRIENKVCYDHWLI